MWCDGVMGRWGMARYQYIILNTYTRPFHGFCHARLFFMCFTTSVVCFGVETVLVLEKIQYNTINSQVHFISFLFMCFNSTSKAFTDLTLISKHSLRNTIQESNKEQRIFGRANFVVRFAHNVKSSKLPSFFFNSRDIPSHKK
jgi:hypothetical protein